jgi:hypothetical protein
MLKTNYILIVASLLIFQACVNGSKHPANPADNATAISISKPGESDLLDALQGKWKSDQDTGQIMEISGNKMLHYTSNKFSFQTEIEIDVKCENNACLVGQDSLVEGWCFSEKGQYDIQCNKVLKCDSQELRIKAIGVENGVYSFKKIKGF